jgi:hypothetical protein
METNGNGYLKPVMIGVGIIVLSAAILGSAATTVNQREMTVTLETVQEDVEANTEKTDGIDVMASQINDIKQDVGKILDKLEQHDE